ncbi:alpha/beta hydrolase family protein [Methanosphaera sp.]
MIKQITCTCNGEKIYGLAYIPYEDKKYPTVIFAHGFYVNHTYFTDYAEKLLEHGIASYIFDFRGGRVENKSDGNLMSASVLTEIDDLTEVVHRIKDEEFVDENNLYLLGHSQGGYVSAVVASRNPTLFKTLFLLAPGFLIPDVMKKMTLPKEGELTANIAGYVSQKYILDGRKLDIYNEITNYKGPVHIFHGSNDNAVALTYSQKAVKLYENAELIIIDGEHHNFRENGKTVVFNKILDVIKGK